MKPKQLIDTLGGTVAVAQALGIELPQTVGNWRKRGFPAWAIPALSRLCEQRGIDPGTALELSPRARTAA